MDPLSSALEPEETLSERSVRSPVIEKPKSNEQMVRNAANGKEPRKASLNATSTYDRPGLFARMDSSTSSNSFSSFQGASSSPKLDAGTPNEGVSKHANPVPLEMDADPEAGPSDYWRRSRSPSPPSSRDLGSPPSTWRELSKDPWDGELNDGPSDVWSNVKQDRRTRNVRAKDPNPGAKIPSINFGFEGVQRWDENGVFTSSTGAYANGNGMDEGHRDQASSSHSGALKSRLNGGLGRPSVSDEGGQAWENASDGVGDDSEMYDESFKKILEVSARKQRERLGQQGEEEEFGVLETPVKRPDLPSSVSIASLRSSDSLPGHPNTTPIPFKRSPSTSYLHPSISRLRSHMRTTSSSTQNSVPHRPSNLAHSRLSSHFSQISLAKSDTASNFSHRTSQAPAASSQPEFSSKPRQDETPPFAFHALKQLSSNLYRKSSSDPTDRPPVPRKASSVLGIPFASSNDAQPVTSHGTPTVMDVRGMIVVGTDTGLLLVYGFDQKLRYTLRNDPQASSGPVTTVTISPDNTYIAVGHASGNIHLYDLANPVKPARTTVALTLKQVHSGRKEGHLQGSRILHIGFMGSRHTSIISGDEHGRAFWWSLGKVIGVESNDVVRMLGNYPETNLPIPPQMDGQSGQSTPASGRGGRRATTLFSAQLLPLGKSPHPTDTFNFTALLTPVKLVVVGMKPTPRTWFRKLRESDGGESGRTIGCAAWKASNTQPGCGPVLAYSWGEQIRFLRIRVNVTEREEGDPPRKIRTEVPEFIEGSPCSVAGPILVLQWYDENHLLVVTPDELLLLRVSDLKTVERQSLQASDLISTSLSVALGDGRGMPQSVMPALYSSVRAHRGKVFILTRENLKVGNLFHWNDRILRRVHQGDFLDAIQIALAYYEDRVDGNTIDLPDDRETRRKVVGARIKELIRASLEWAFSEDRMHDDTHFSKDGRGVDLTELFEGLAKSCIDSCLSLDDTSFLYDQVYEYFVNAGIHNILLKLMEPYLYDGRIHGVPPTIVKALIAMHDDAGEYEAAETVIWTVDPLSLDINQAVTLCEAHGLWDALIHVYTRSLGDFVAPLVKLNNDILSLQESRSKLSNGQDPFIEDDDDHDMVHTAYKVYTYLEYCLSGLSFPSNEPLRPAQAISARDQVYNFVFSRQSMTWPTGSSSVVKALNPDNPYPYLDLLVRFDAEAFLNSMDVAFEDPYLNDSNSIWSRQSLVDTLLDVINPAHFESPDITLLHIFVARNLPKYAQFLSLPTSRLHEILVSLASDEDQNTLEDRQLATEFLLSAYTPKDLESVLPLFQSAGFYRILQSIYRRQKRWGALVTACIDDPEMGYELFSALDAVMSTSSKRQQQCLPEVEKALSTGLQSLLDLSVPQTAILVDNNIPTLHSKAIELLNEPGYKQLAYLRCILDPSPEDENSDLGYRPRKKGISESLDMPARLLYVSLLFAHDATSVVTFLDTRGPTFFDLPELEKRCAEIGCIEGELWAIDRQGNTRKTFKKVGNVIRSDGTNLAKAVVENQSGDIHIKLQAIQTASQMALRLCKEHTVAGFDDLEDMWYGVLHEVVDLAHSIGSLLPAPGDTGEGSQGEGKIVVETLRSMVQETLQALVASASPALSFPRLFKRLVEGSTLTGSAKKSNTAYSEFRTILGGMLDSYRSEGEMLSMTTKLVEADLFDTIELMTRKRQMGWRPGNLSCVVCGKSSAAEPSSASNADDEEGRGIGWIILASGEVKHQNCVPL